MREMKIFFKDLIRFSIFGVSVFLLLIIGYFCLDPFKVVYKYGDYSGSSYVTINRDYISTETYLNQKDKYHYNSFVFGSSRTLGYSPVTWTSYLDSSAEPFVYDATMESIYGIYKKIKFLDSLHVDIKNVLFIFCRDYTFSQASNPTDHLLIKHPLLTGQSQFEYQETYLKAYFNFNFLASYYTYLVTRKQMPFMNEYINEKRIMYDPVTNHMKLVDDERLLQMDPEKYYTQFAHRFYFSKDENGMLRNEIIIPEVETYEEKNQIQQIQLKMLKEIKQILEKHRTHYTIILHPLLDKKKFSFKDKEILDQLFGKNVYDFTGLNEFTKSYKDYYDWSHCRPYIGDTIFKRIYTR